MATAKTILAIGQDLFSIDAYVKSQYNYSLHRYLGHLNNGTTARRRDKGATARRRDKITTGDSADGAIPTVHDVTPPAFMAYTDLQTLRGLDSPADYGSGVEYADGILQLVAVQPGDTVGLQLGLWLNGTEGCRDVVEGRLDANILRLVAYLSSAAFDHVWLRIGYEFDNPSFGYFDDPELYQLAFRTIVKACRSDSKCRRRTRFVWHSWAASVTDPNKLMPFYPGDDAVDWIGISLFSQLYAPGAMVARLGNDDTVRTVLEFARRHQKPTMIAESTPFGGISARTEPWEAWFQPVLDLIREHGIAMWCYINCDWESQPMWHQVGFGDTRLESNGTVLRLWHEEVLQNPDFHTNWNAGLDELESSEAAVPLLAMLSPFLSPQRPYQLGGPLLSSLLFLSAVALAVAALAAFLSMKARTRPSKNGSRISPEMAQSTCDTEGDCLNAKSEWRVPTVYGAIH